MEDKSLDIDLGVKPANPVPFPEPPAGTPEKFYPSCYVSDVDLEDLPESGTMTVKYRLSRSEKNHKTGKWSYTIELEKIVSATKGEDESEESDREEELDEMLDEVEGKKGDK